MINGKRITREGYPIDAYYLYICDGIFQSEDEVKHHAYQSANTHAGDLIFRDVSGPEGVPDGQITEDDRVVTGSSVPDFTYSFGLNLDYKGIGLNVFFKEYQELALTLLIIWCTPMLMEQVLPTNG